MAQLQPQLEYEQGGSGGRSGGPLPAPPSSLAGVRAWARRAVEARTAAAGWQFVIDSLQHEQSYLQQRLNSLSQRASTAGAGGSTAAPAAAGDASELAQLEAELAVVQQQLQQAQQAQHAAQQAFRADPAALLGWLGGSGAGVAELQQVARAFLAELIQCR